MKKLLFYFLLADLLFLYKAKNSYTPKFSEIPTFSQSSIKTVIYQQLNFKIDIFLTKNLPLTKKPTSVD